MPSPIATAAPDLPLALPPAADPVQPDATWGRLAFRIQKGGGDCYVAMLRFPDALTVLSPSEPPPTEPPPASPPAPGASPGPQPAAESCEFTFAPDGSAFVRASQAYASFEVMRGDGTRLSGPMPLDVPEWSPGSNWLARADWMMRPDGSERRELPGPPSWSPNDQVLAVQGDDGMLLVGAAMARSYGRSVTYPCRSGWAPDGSVFAFVRDGDAWLALADGSQARNLTRFPLGGVTGAWWSPDGRWIAILQGTTMWAFSPDGSIRHRLGSGLGPNGVSWGTSASWAPAWSQDGAWLAIEHDDPTGTHGGREQVVTLVHAGDWRAVRLRTPSSRRFLPMGATWRSSGVTMVAISPTS